MGLRVRWPKAYALPEPTEPEEWHQIILGDHREALPCCPGLRGYGLIELLVSIAVGALLMVGLSPLLATFGDLADSVEQRADLQERIRLLHHMWTR